MREGGGREAEKEARRSENKQEWKLCGGKQKRKIINPGQRDGKGNEERREWRKMMGNVKKMEGMGRRGKRRWNGIRMKTDVRIRCITGGSYGECGQTGRG